MANYEVKSDKDKNVLYLTMEGFLKDDEINIVADQAVKEAAKLKKGFHVINDLSKFKVASKEGTELIKQAQLNLAKMGIGRVIRVTGDKAVGSAQFQRTAKDAGYSGETASTVAEAESMLS